MRNRWWKLLSASLLLFAAMFTFLPSSADAASSEFVVKGDTDRKVVALTFDDGADGTNIGSILSTLSDHNVTATFFLTGRGVEHHPQSIRNIAEAGHELANHSYSHPDFTTLTPSQMKTELRKAEELIKQTTGITSKPLFRAPYGATNSAVLQAVGEAGYTHTLHWDVDTIDWRGDSKTVVLNRVMDNVQPGSIVLMHTGAGAPGTPAALPEMITQLKAQGYEFVTISEMLNLKPASSPGGGATYTVQAGDTLFSIARRHDVTVSEMVSANNITNPNLLSIGQVLTIPGDAAGEPSPPAESTTYRVNAGDTLFSIANRHGVSVDQLMSVNNITDPRLLQIGQMLEISSSGTSDPPATSTTYTVKAGETMYSIALRHGSTVQQIAQANNISNPALISIGQVLTIPE